MYQQFTYEEARRHDAYRTSHASDPMSHSAFRRHRRPILRWWQSIRQRVRTRDVVIDLREPRRPAAPPVGFPEFLDAPDPLAVDNLALTTPKVE